MKLGNKCLCDHIARKIKSLLIKENVDRNSGIRLLLVHFPLCASLCMKAVDLKQKSLISDSFTLNKKNELLLKLL